MTIETTDNGNQVLIAREATQNEIMDWKKANSCELDLIEHEYGDRERELMDKQEARTISLEELKELLTIKNKKIEHLIIK
jgi:hypothetical protein